MLDLSSERYVGAVRLPSQIYNKPCSSPKSDDYSSIEIFVIMGALCSGHPVNEADGLTYFSLRTEPRCRFMGCVVSGLYLCSTPADYSEYMMSATRRRVCHQ